MARGEGFFRRAGKAVGRGVGRLFGRGKEEAPAEEAPPSPPPAPEPEAPPAPPEPGEGPGEGPPVAGPDVEREPDEPAPSSLYVAVPGAWIVSENTKPWRGTISGTLHGQDVIDFLDAMEAGDTTSAVQLVANVYDDGSGFADRVRIEDSDIWSINY